MLAVLLLLHRRRSRSGLSARAHLGAVSPAILLQRPQLAGATIDDRGHRFHHGRQRLRAHRRLAARAGTRGRLLTRPAPPRARPPPPDGAPRGPPGRPNLPLEP